MTAMESYQEIDGGLPVVSSSYYLNDILRDELGFDGLLVNYYYYYYYY